MIHEMKLQEKFYNYILYGTKRIEIRLNDEKRRLIKTGDTIAFSNMSNMNNYFKAKVIELIKFNDFSDLINNFDISLLSDKNITKEELINSLETFYTKEDQNKYGVLAIKIELIN